MDEAAATASMQSNARVDAERVSAVISRWTGIPQGTLTDAQRAGLLALEAELEERVVGQSAAVATVSQAIRRARAGLKDPRKPVGGFLFVGPSGVGKTELARALAHALFGTDEALVRLDLSEYTEAHTISRLLGAPPGYAGHDEPGQLTEAGSPPAVFRRALRRDRESAPGRRGDPTADSRRRPGHRRQRPQRSIFATRSSC